MTHVLRALALLAPLFFLAGCGREVERAAERRVNGLLPALVGPADKYGTRVRGNPDALLRGRMRSVHIDGEGVRMTEELTLDTLTLDLTGVTVDVKAKRLSGIESVTFAATLGEGNLNRYVRARHPGIPGLQVALGQAGATVHARPEIFGGIAAPLAIEGVITPRAGGGLLDFLPGGARVSVVPVPAPVLRYVAERLNPVLDLSTLRVPIRVEKAQIRQGALLLTGTVDPANLLRAGESAAMQ
jgi:hypothetical protein